MAEDHRRVESRSIIGTGMATDPERIQEVQDNYDRRMRTDADAPKRSFDQVMEEGPAEDDGEGQGEAMEVEGLEAPDPESAAAESVPADVPMPLDLPPEKDPNTEAMEKLLGKSGGLGLGPIPVAQLPRAVRPGGGKKKPKP
jgi:hypothetical protein